MPDFGDILTRKVGPLPVGGWAIAVVGGLGIAYYINRGSGGGASSPPPPAIADAPGGLHAVPGSGAGSDVLFPVIPGDGPNLDPGDDVEGDGPTTNAQWARLAFDAGRGLGFGALAVTTAVSKYLTGQTLTPKEGQIIEAILSEIGQTPNPVPTPRIEAPERRDPGTPSTPTRPPSEPTPSPTDRPPSTSTTRTPGRSVVVDNRNTTFVVEWSTLSRWRVPGGEVSNATSLYGRPLTRVSETPADNQRRQREFLESIGRPKTSPAIYLDQRMGWREVGTWSPPSGARGGSGGGRSYTIRRGDTLSGIAARFLGSSALWPRIWEANRSRLRSGDPNLIFPGEVIIIPN